VEGFSAIFRKTLLTKAEASVHKFHVRALPQRIIDNSLVFINGNGARGID
jgi:hypothetical protein